jgi:dolichyl-phosphate beta-glucosyltransferase
VNGEIAINYCDSGGSGVGMRLASCRGNGSGGATRPHTLEVIVPALNEEKRLSRCLRALREQIDRLDDVCGSIRVIDNGSTDRTSEVVDEVNRTCLNTPVAVQGCARPGKGSAVARGMVTSSADWVGFCDADLATPASTISEAVTFLRDGWAVVVGSRAVAGASRARRQSTLRCVGGAGFRLLTSELVRDVRDTQCGFKFFQGEAARQLFSRARLTGFAFDIEILALAADLGLSIKEIPVTWTNGEHSTLRPLHDAPQILREVQFLRRQRRISRVTSATVALDAS